MALSEWVVGGGNFDGGISSPNDAPAGGTNPTISLAQVGAESIASFVPSGSTLNGKDITNIVEGYMEGFMKIFLTAASGARGAVLFRWVDNNNHYRVEFNTNDVTVNQMQIIRRTASVDTVIATVTPLTGVAINDNEWFKFRITWWSAAGFEWTRVEVADIVGGSGLFVQQGADTADTGDSHKGAGIKIGIGASSSFAGTFTARFDDIQVFRKKTS